MGRSISLELFGKVFWSRYRGDGVTLSTGEDMVFDDVHSLRARLGGRLTHAMGAGFDLSAGAAYEYEFAGDARASVEGYSLDTPSLGGGTGVGELGVLYRAASGRGFGGAGDCRQAQGRGGECAGGVGVLTLCPPYKAKSAKA